MSLQSDIQDLGRTSPSPRLREDQISSIRAAPKQIPTWLALLGGGVLLGGLAAALVLTEQAHERSVRGWLSENLFSRYAE
ncbi:MAG: hypothetical protein QM820_56390 [Minicystis sp.]